MGQLILRAGHRRFGTLCGDHHDLAVGPAEHQVPPYLVQYQQVFDLSSLFRLLGKSEAPKLKIDLGAEPPQIKAGQLYFLSTTFAH